MIRVIAKIIRFFKTINFLWEYGEKGLLRDSLTDLYNRFYIEELTEKEIYKFKRTGCPFCIIFIDIDGLKIVNDRKGHLRGDNLIKELADIIKKNLRKMDSASRWQGDEFLILMPDSHKEAGEIFKKRIKNDTKIEISVGVSQWKEGMDFKRLFGLADKRMYREKNKKKA